MFVLSALCDDFDFFSAMGADEGCGGDGGFVGDGSRDHRQRFFGDDGGDCRIQRVRDFLEACQGEVSVEVVLNGPDGESEFVSQFLLRHSSLLEDEFDVFLYVHNSMLG